MKIAAVRYPVDQWQAAKHFYRDVLGLPLIDSDDGLGHATFGTEGGPPLELVRHPVRAGAGGGAMVSLVCPDVEALRARLLEAGARVEPELQESPSARILTFYDPDGNPIEAVQRMGGPK
jgi:catechol 2,3-dioxygenase-like lactoylglutathione lyase family enzyme